MGFVKPGTRTSQLAVSELKKSKLTASKKRKRLENNCGMPPLIVQQTQGRFTGYENHDKPWPPLERLPAEILQDIFIRSLNPNLAIASPRLNRVLSPSSGYLKLEMLVAVLRKVMELACGYEVDIGNGWKAPPPLNAASDLLTDHFKRGYVTSELFRAAEIKALAQAPWPPSTAIVEKRIHATVDADRNMLMLPDFELPRRLLMPPYTAENMKLLLSIYERMNFEPSKTKSGILERALMVAIRERNTVMMAMVLHNIGVRVTKYHMAEAFTKSTAADYESDEGRAYERSKLDEEQILGAELNLQASPLSKLFKKRGSEQCVAIRVVNMLKSWMWSRTRQQLQFDDIEIWQNALATGGPIQDWLFHNGSVPFHSDIFNKVGGMC